VHQRAVLVGAAFHHQLLGRRHTEPGPAAAEARQCGLGEGFLEAGEAAQLRVDRRRQLALRFTAARGRHHGPEQAVVGVSAAVVDHRATKAFRHLFDAPHQLVHRQLAEGIAFQRRVEVGDVGLVVLGVVDLHGLRVNVRFQGIVGVGQWGQAIRHGRSPF